MIEKLIAMFVSKKRIIGWIAAVAFAVGATGLGMSTDEFKGAVCGAQAIQPVNSQPVEQK